MKVEGKVKKRVDAVKAELKTKYCIPNWLRDEQIKMSCARFKKRIEVGKEINKEKFALVGFGPSLNQTWEYLKDFKYIMTCSGSHKFLTDRGITPTYHVEVDPREHKIKLIGDKISKDTTFLMASCVHPKVFDHLEDKGANIVLWHTYSGEKHDKLPMVYPKGEWVSTGGANVGLRALVLARMLGFTNIHIFGLDGSFPADGYRHADEHPNMPKDYIIAEFDGKEYATTTGFLECGRSTIHEIEQLPDVEVTFYGKGLIQDMVRKKQEAGELKRKTKATIAFYVQPTISQEYIEQNRILHETNPTYGVSVFKHIETIKKLYQETECHSILDYGCGKGLLAKNIDFPIWEYDPAIPGKDATPRGADLVICVDVLEHIEPDYLDSVLRDIARCTLKIGYLIISTKLAVKKLPDGRNTHLIVEGKDFWRKKIERFLRIPKNGLMEKNGELHIIVSPKWKAIETRETFTLNREAQLEHTAAA